MSQNISCLQKNVNCDDLSLSHLENEKKNTEDSQNEEEEEEESEESELDDGAITDEEDSEFDPDDDPEKLWCFCKKPHGNRYEISHFYFTVNNFYSILFYRKGYNLCSHYLMIFH